MTQAKRRIRPPDQPVRVGSCVRGGSGPRRNPAPGPTCTTASRGARWHARRPRRSTGSSRAGNNNGRIAIFPQTRPGDTRNPPPTDRPGTAEEAPEQGRTDVAPWLLGPNDRGRPGRSASSRRSHAMTRSSTGCRHALNGRLVGQQPSNLGTGHHRRHRQGDTQLASRLRTVHLPPFKPPRRGVRLVMISSALNAPSCTVAVLITDLQRRARFTASPIGLSGDRPADGGPLHPGRGGTRQRRDD